MKTWMIVILILAAFELGALLGGWWTTREMEIEEEQDEKEISRKIMEGGL